MVLEQENLSLMHNASAICISTAPTLILLENNYFWLTMTFLFSYFLSIIYKYIIFVVFFWSLVTIVHDLGSECEYHEIDIDYWANDTDMVPLADEDTTINTNVTLSHQIINSIRHNRSSHHNFQFSWLKSTIIFLQIEDQRLREFNLL